MSSGGLLLLLFISLLLITFILCVLFEADIMQPAVLMSGTMTFSALLAWLSSNQFGTQIGWKTYFCLILAIGSFSIGSMWSHLKLKWSTYTTGYIEKKYKVHWLMYGALLVVMGIMLFFSTRELYDLSIQLGNTNGLKGMISTIRPALEGHQIKFSRWMNYRQIIAQTITYIYLFLFTYQMIYHQFKWKYLLFLLPSIIYSGFVMLTTGRMSMVALIIFEVVIFCVLYQKKKRFHVTSRLKCVAILFIAGISFLVLFFVMGHLTGKVISEEHSAFVILAHYAGLSIPALDVQLNKIWVDNLLVGSNSLHGIYSILNRLGMNLPEVQIFLPFTQFSNINTNVYTAEGRYVRDFGYIGMIAIMWILGVFYTVFYDWVLYQSHNEFAIILFGTISYPLFLSSIDERFFLDLLGSQIIYFGILIYLFCLLIIQKESSPHV